MYSLNRLSVAFHVAVTALFGVAMKTHEIEDSDVTPASVREALDSPHWDHPTPTQLLLRGQEEAWIEDGDAFDTWAEWARIVEGKAAHAEAPEPTDQESWNQIMSHIVENIDTLLRTDLSWARPHEERHQPCLIDLRTEVERLEARLTIARAQRDEAIRSAYEADEPATAVGRWAGVHRNYVHRIAAGDRTQA